MGNWGCALTLLAKIDAVLAPSGYLTASSLAVMPEVNATFSGEGKGEALGWDVADQPGYSPNRNTAGALATLGIGKHTLPTAAIIKSFMRKDTLNTMK